MTINNKLAKMLAIPTMAAALATPASGVVIASPNGITSNSTSTSVDYDFLHTEDGSPYESLLGQHQLVDMLWQIPEVKTEYGNNFGSFATDSSVHGYSIEAGISPVGNGWFSSLNADGTYNVENVGGFAGFDFDEFNANKTMNGNYFFNNSLTDVNDDGKNDYELKFLGDLTPTELSDSFTITGSLPTEGQHSIIANSGIDQFTNNYDSRLAFVATGG